MTERSKRRRTAPAIRASARTSTDRDLLLLAREAGLSVHWTDAFGAKATVASETMRAVLAAMRLPCHSPSAIKESRNLLQDMRSKPPPLTVARRRAPIALRGFPRHARALSENGCVQDLTVERTETGAACVRAPDHPGYYTIQFGNRHLKVAVAPGRLPTKYATKRWGIVAQIYSLPGGTTRGFGDFAALRDMCERAGKAGAAAVAISPAHALLPSSLENYSPYAPSSRQFLNPLFAPLGRKSPRTSRSRLIDWKTAYRQKQKALQSSYGAFKRDAFQLDAFLAFVSEGGDRLIAHARFEALHARFERQGCKGWRDWPPPFRHSRNAEVLGIPITDEDVEFHLFAQWRAAKALEDAQQTAKAAGMEIGLIADLAVGIDPNGSDAWSAPDDMLDGLTIGAPPDALGPDGQNWGLTSFSPNALHSSAFASFISTLRAVMRSSGGVRIDHAMGFRRLWVIPQGAPTRAGAYLHYPFEELMSLTALEAFRRKAMVIAEDLGTVPGGFREELARKDFHGMRVLWFERGPSGDFLPSRAWEPNACAMTSTHDLPTVVGWWRGRDIEWRERVVRKPNPSAKRKAKRERELDRDRLWQTLKAEKCVKGARPPPTQPNRILDGALRFVARSRSRIALFPLEDLAGALEQPNLPGTVSVHPNWRRRFAASAVKSKQFSDRLALIAAERDAGDARLPRSS